MYCSSCGKDIPNLSWRCSACGRATTAFWLHVYGAATLVVAGAGAVFYFLKLVPIATQAFLQTGAEIPIVMRWQIAVSDFVQSWLFMLIVLAVVLGPIFLRFAGALPGFLRSGHFAAMLALLATTALLATLLMGFWSVVYAFFYDTTEVISGLAAHP
jgi:hypothetical protein